MVESKPQTHQELHLQIILKKEVIKEYSVQFE